MPRPPQTIKHHPSSVHVELLSTLLRESKEMLLVKFLAKDFSCTSPNLAAKLLQEMRLRQHAALVLHGASMEHDARLRTDDRSTVFARHLFSGGQPLHLVDGSLVRLHARVALGAHDLPRHVLVSALYV